MDEKFQAITVVCFYGIEKDIVIEISNNYIMYRTNYSGNKNGIYHSKTLLVLRSYPKHPFRTLKVANVRLVDFVRFFLIMSGLLLISELTPKDWTKNLAI